MYGGTITSRKGGAIMFLLAPAQTLCSTKTEICIGPTKFKYVANNVFFYIITLRIVCCIHRYTLNFHFNY